MGKTTGFLEFGRKNESKTAVNERIRHFNEFTIPLNKQELKNQGARCMNCGIPFCHSGCPLGNLIPDFNDAVYKGHWQKASNILHQTNNFPEFTGRLCPAPCEEACVLNINSEPVTIENIEKNIVEQAFENNWLKAESPEVKTGKKIAVIGSGPAGLATADQLNKAGHKVTVFEKDLHAGGLLRYGIPDFKLEKSVIDRRLKLMIDAGIEFNCGCEIGVNCSVTTLTDQFDAIALCVGANVRRELMVEGSNLKGVIQAMDFLKHNNQVVAKELQSDADLSAHDKNIIVIGGGDTGSDCIGTAIRQGAKSVLNFEIMPKPPHSRTELQPWPFWPMKLRSSTSHQEGVTREWSIATKEFIGDKKGNLTGLRTVQVEWSDKMKLNEISGTEKDWPCDMVLLAMGFVGTKNSLANDFKLSLTDQQLFASDNIDFQIDNQKIFAAGDCRKGQSLIVWAISEGREMAYSIDRFLMGESRLRQKGPGDLPGP